MLTYESLPYRPCVGLVVLKRTGRVFIGKRRGGPEHVDDTHSWQMPQGGVDPGEEPWPAALLFASGMAAINAIITMLKSGDHVVAGHNLYGGTPRRPHWRR